LQATVAENVEEPIFQQLQVSPNLYVN